MNIRYPIYEGVYRILTLHPKPFVNMFAADTDNEPLIWHDHEHTTLVFRTHVQGLRS